MKIVWRSALGVSIAALAASGRGDAEQGTKWPKASCSILATDAVAEVLHKPVTARAQDAIATCDYLTGGADDISIQYWNDKVEFEIMKSLMAKRGKQGTPVSDLGAEAMYGTYGTDGGLAVRLADGRAFMVVGHDRKAELAVARLIVAKA
jgi:hypothetical protein